MSDDWRDVWNPVLESVGVDISDGQARMAIDRVEAGAIRRYLEPLEFDCALHSDSQVARAHGYRDVTAPYTAAMTFALGPLWKPGPPLFASAERNAQPVRSAVKPAAPKGAPDVTGYFATDTEIDFLRPVIAGERLGRRGNKLLSCEPKETKLGRGAFLKYETDLVDEAGEAVARVRTTYYLYNPHPSGGR